MGLLDAIQPSPDGGMGLLGSVLSRIDAMKRRAGGLLDSGSIQQLLSSVAEDARANADLAGQGIANSGSVMPGMAQTGAQQTMQAGMGPAMGLMTVYHGSPHLFDKFDMSKIGTGEGAQAYGHGIYFADNPQVAKSYHKDLAGTYDATRQLGPPPNGAVYKVDIPDEAIGRMLQWDKPLTEQPPNVQGALGQFAQSGQFQMGPGGAINLAGGGTLRSYGTETGLKYVLDMGGKQFQLSPQDVQNLIGTGVEGKSLYQVISSQLGGDERASQFLASKGIPGIRYLDQGSRTSGDGTYNTVLFDDSLARILGRE